MLLHVSVRASEDKGIIVLNSWDNEKKKYAEEVRNGPFEKKPNNEFTLQISVLEDKYQVNSYKNVKFYCPPVEQMLALECIFHMVIFSHSRFTSMATSIANSYIVIQYRLLASCISKTTLEFIPLQWINKIQTVV